MLEATIRSGLGDLPGAVDLLGGVTGFHVGVGMVGTPAGMVKHPDAIAATRVVAGRLRWDDPLGDRPYTARLMYGDERRLDGPFPLTPQLRNGHDALTPEEPAILHPLEERYARLVQADALLAWAETLYRTDDAANLERARELYKAVMFLHGEDPGHQRVPAAPRLPSPAPMVRSGREPAPAQPARPGPARAAATGRWPQLLRLQRRGGADLRYETLVGAAQRWTTGAKSAQSDYLAYLGKVEQADLDLLTAKAQERKARITVAISAEQVEIAKAGVIVAQKLVADVEKLIAAKQQEIEDANSIFSQFKDYFSGMKSSVSSLVDVGKAASEGYAGLSSSSAGSALGLGEGGGAGAGSAGSRSVGLGSAAGGLAVVGGFAAFAVLSTTTLQGMADAATKRDGELKALKDEALPAAKAAVRVQERHVAIAGLQGEIAATDLAYARDLVNYQNERFLNRDFWDALAGVARRSLHRYLDLAGQAAWFAERALAYQLATPVRVIRLDYFDLRMRDVGGADRLGLDLAELEAIRLGAARITVPITRTYSLARDLPLAFGQLKRTGRCTFGLTDDDLLTGHPGTFAHRIRSVDVAVDAPGTAVATGASSPTAASPCFARHRTPRRCRWSGSLTPIRSASTGWAASTPVSRASSCCPSRARDSPRRGRSGFRRGPTPRRWTGSRTYASRSSCEPPTTRNRWAPRPRPSPARGRCSCRRSPPIPRAWPRCARRPPVAKVRFLPRRVPRCPQTAKITNLAVLIPGVDDGALQREAPGWLAGCRCLLSPSRTVSLMS